MARQLFGATCLRPSARSDKAQVSVHPDFAIELTVTSHLQKLRSVSCYCPQHWLLLLEFCVIRERGIRPDRIFGKDRPSQIKFLGRAAGSKREAYQRCR